MLTIPDVQVSIFVCVQTQEDKHAWVNTWLNFPDATSAGSRCIKFGIAILEQHELGSDWKGTYVSARLLEMQPDVSADQDILSDVDRLRGTFVGLQTETSHAHGVEITSSQRDQTHAWIQKTSWQPSPSKTGRLTQVGVSWPTCSLLRRLLANQQSETPECAVVFSLSCKSSGGSV